MSNTDWLQLVAQGCSDYNQGRLHTDFQEEEVLKFVQWLHQQHNVEYTKPKATHQNTPEFKQYWKGIKE